MERKGAFHGFRNISKGWHEKLTVALTKFNHSRHKYNCLSTNNIKAKFVLYK